MADYAVSMDALELMMTPQPPPQPAADSAPAAEKATGGGNTHRPSTAASTPHTTSDRSRSDTFDPDRFLTENDDDGFVADCAASYAASPLRLLLSKPTDAAAGLVAGSTSNPQAPGDVGTAAAGAPSATVAASRLEPQSQSSSGGTSASHNPPLSPSTPETARGERTCLPAPHTVDLPVLA